MKEDIEILENLLKNASPFTMNPRIYIALENLIKGYKEKDTKINKLNKVIDKMAEYINKHIVVISRDIEESICCHNLDGKCINRKCEECVKKYFIEKED